MSLILYPFCVSVCGKGHIFKLAYFVLTFEKQVKKTLLYERHQCILKDLFATVVLNLMLRVFVSQLGYVIYRRVLRYYSGEEDGLGKAFCLFP